MTARALAAAVFVATAFASSACGQDVANAGDRDVRAPEDTDLRVADLVRSGGRATAALLVLSIGAIAVGIYVAVDTRRSRVMPDGIHAAALAQARAHNRAGCLDALSRHPSVYARAAVRALGVRRLDARETAAASGARDAAVARNRLRVLSALAFAALMVGALGALGGLIGSFGAAAREQLHYALVYAGIMRALVATFAGVCVAFVSMTIHFMLRWRLDGALADAAYALDELIRAAGDDAAGDRT